MLTRRRLVIALGAGALAPLAALAQKPAAKFARIGFLSAASASQAETGEALRKGLRDLGYVEGKNVVLEYRWAQGKYERLPELAAELVRLEVDVLVTSGTPATLAAKQTTAAIPLVMVDVGDAVTNGLVASLARPGGNVTGMTVLSAEQLMAKQLELLRDAVPHARQVGILLNPAKGAQGVTFQAIDIRARALKVGVHRFEARDLAEFDGAFSDMARERVDAVAITAETLFNTHTKVIATLALRWRLPSIGNREFAENGGLLGFGVNNPDMYRHAAVIVDKILKGAKPADLPVGQPAKLELVVNMKTAKALGINIPDSIRLRANKVIE